jgi:hypothetical protein
VGMVPGVVAASREVILRFSRHTHAASPAIMAKAAVGPITAPAIHALDFGLDDDAGWVGGFEEVKEAEEVEEAEEAEVVPAAVDGTLAVAVSALAADADVDAGTGGGRFSFGLLCLKVMRCCMWRREVEGAWKTNPKSAFRSQMLLLDRRSRPLLECCTQMRCVGSYLMGR